MTKDMTEGNVLGLILRFALPLLVGQFITADIQYD